MRGTSTEDASDVTDRRVADQLLVRVVGRGGSALFALAATALVLAIAETAFPVVLGRAIDAVVGTAPRSWLTWCAVLVAVLVILDALDDLAAGAVTARSTAWLRHTLVRQILAVGPRSVGRFPPGELASRVVANAAAAGGVTPELVRAIANLIPSVGGIVALVVIDPWIGLTFATGLPALLLLLRAFARDATQVSRRYLEVQGRIAGALVDALSGARTIAAAGTADREAQRVLGPLPELHRHGMGMWNALIRVSAQNSLVVPLMEIAVLAVGGAQLARGRLTPGELLAAGQYVVLASGLGSAVTTVTRLARSRAAAQRVAEVLAQPAVAYGTAQLPSGGGRIEFRGVSMRAGGRRVLDGLDLCVPGGALIAVVGHSGAGKSLLAALAGRLVDPDEGEVVLDGVGLRQLGKSELRREVAYGFERPVLIGETIADAIAFGERTSPPDAVVAAARAAQADPFIRRMPYGYATRLADAPMSGGEVQRVGLARAFAHAGRVVVLDDVAASLDTVTEHQISKVLTGELAGRTRLVVAHRASTAARADLVAWLDEGRVRLLAPHGELWRDQDYRSLFEPEGDLRTGRPGPMERVSTVVRRFLRAASNRAGTAGTIGDGRELP